MSAATAREQRHQQAIDARLHRATYEEIGRLLGITAEGARRLVQRAWREVIDAIELELMVCRRTDDVLVLPIPFGEAFEFEAERARLTVQKLRERGLDVICTYHPRPDGLAFAIRDVTDYAASAGSEEER